MKKKKHPKSKRLGDHHQFFWWGTGDHAALLQDRDFVQHARQWDTLRCNHEEIQETNMKILHLKSMSQKTKPSQAEEKISPRKGAEKDHKRQETSDRSKNLDWNYTSNVHSSTELWLCKTVVLFLGEINEEILKIKRIMHIVYLQMAQKKR